VIYLQIIMYLMAFAGLMWFMLGVTVRRKDTTVQVCAKCAYSLVGIDQPLCPECGRERRLAGEPDTAGTISHIIAVAIATTFVAILASSFGPELVYSERDGVIGLNRTSQPAISFVGSAQRWRFPPRDGHPELEPDWIRFGQGQHQIEVVRDLHGSGWLESGTRSPVDADDVMRALGVSGLEPAITDVLTDSWVHGSIGSVQSPFSRPIGQPFAEIHGTSSGSAQTLLPTYAIQLITWVLAVRRIWYLF
jgi:hypothetical protein